MLLLVFSMYCYAAVHMCGDQRAILEFISCHLFVGSGSDLGQAAGACSLTLYTLIL